MSRMSFCLQVSVSQSESHCVKTFHIIQYSFQTCWITRPKTKLWRSLASLLHLLRMDALPPWNLFCAPFWHLPVTEPRSPFLPVRGFVRVQQRAVRIYLRSSTSCQIRPLDVSICQKREFPFVSMDRGRKQRTRLSQVRPEWMSMRTKRILKPCLLLA